MTRGKKHELEGQEFGRLIVLEEKGTNEHGHVEWICECECGEETVTISNHLVTGHTKSCGCLAQENRIESQQLEKGEAARRMLYRNYKRSADQRNLEFELDRQEFINKATNKCYYCGAEPSKELPRDDLHGNIQYNGIDRLDSDKGYVGDNTVPCCELCNFMKKDMDEEEFITRIEKIAENKDMRIK